MPAPVDRPSSSPPPRLAVVTCAVMETEVEHLMRGMSHVVAYHKLEQGLHNEPDRLRVELQRAVDEIETNTDAEAIALVYGLCSRGVEGVRAKRCRLALARAHDCITLLLGSRERYARYVERHPGTYWYSPGWNRHHLPPGPDRHASLRRSYVEKYGEDNADFLMENEQHWFSTYRRAAYVHLSIGASDSDRDYTRRCADWLSWDYEEVAGDPALLRALLAADWSNDDILVLEPGQTIRLTADEQVIDARPAEVKTRDDA